MYIHTFLSPLYKSKKLTVMFKSTKVIASVIVSLSLLACGGGEQKKNETSSQKATKKEEVKEVRELSINPAESKVHWSGSVIGVYSHKGTVNIVDGIFVMKGNKVVDGQFTADMSSMLATDENYTPEEGKSKEKLIEHLSSDDFFNIAEFPTASFSIKSHDLDDKAIIGDLTIRGITKEEVVSNVEVDFENGSAYGKLTFDRKAFNVAFSHPAKDVVIKDEIELEIKLTF